MSATEDGARLFTAINDAIKGTAINRSDLYRGYGSLLGRYAPKVPESIARVFFRAGAKAECLTKTHLAEPRESKRNSSFS
mgnify:CR=1 FL=1